MTAVGMERRASSAWTLERGAKVVEGGVHFVLWAPKAKRAMVRVESGRARGDHELRAVGKNVFEATIDGVEAGDDYRYVLDGGRPLSDPVSRFQPEGVHGPSRVVDPTTFAWTDDEWRGRAMADYVIYELHVGTFSDERTFDGVAARLGELRELGITAIEIMPVAQFPGTRNWGYDGVSLFAPQNSYGGPDGLRRLVDAAHAEGIAVILDVVYNHVGPEGNYLGEFGPYFADRYKTPWGLAVNYDGPESDEVRRYVIDNALYWVSEFHIDGLRLDAIHGIFDFGARHVLRELADAVHALGRILGRTVVVIGESDLNDPRVVRDTSPYEYAFDAQWSDDLHHAIHAQLTGERAGYYADFDGLEPIAAALERSFYYDGRYSAHRRRKHGTPATGVRGDHFVVCIQNHDQVGNRAIGDRLSTLLPPSQLKLAAALYLLSPYVPMLWMGEEYGETRPFQYFVSHGDKGLLDAVRKGRRQEFESFGWGDEVPDPGAESTFRDSTLERPVATQGAHAQLRALYRDLLRARREERALRPGDAEARVAYDELEGWITMELLHSSGADCFVLFNLGPDARTIPSAATDKGDWRLRLTTDDTKYGGSGVEPRRFGDDAGGSARVTLAAYSAALYCREVR